jgi:hypothetical protein
MSSILPSRSKRPCQTRPPRFFTFTLFSQLPKEIRIEIWHLLFPMKRYIHLASLKTWSDVQPRQKRNKKIREAQRAKHDQCTSPICAHLPITLSINHESRTETLVYYQFFLREVVFYGYRYGYRKMPTVIQLVYFRPGFELGNQVNDILYLTMSDLINGKSLHHKNKHQREVLRGLKSLQIWWFPLVNYDRSGAMGGLSFLVAFSSLKEIQIVLDGSKEWYDSNGIRCFQHCSRDSEIEMMSIKKELWELERSNAHEEAVGALKAFYEIMSNSDKRWKLPKLKIVIPSVSHQIPNFTITVLDIQVEVTCCSLLCSLKTNGMQEATR